MATQFASLTPTVHFPAPHQKVRIAYSAHSSLGAIADALTDQPTPVVEATLEELAITGLAQNLVDAAGSLLSPAMYVAFLSWMDSGYRFASLQTEGDEQAFRLCDDHAADGFRIASMAPVNEHDAAFQTYLYALEATDSTCVGPLLSGSEDVSLLGSLTVPFMDDVLGRSKVGTLIDTLAQQARVVSTTSLAFDAWVRDAVLKVVGDARAANAGRSQTMMMPAAYNPFMRGPWVAWQKAYNHWLEANRTAIDFYDKVLGPAERRYNVVRDRYPRGHDFTIDLVAASAIADVDYPDAWPEQNHRNWTAQNDALLALLKTPAPGPSELATKLKIFRAEDAHNLMEAGLLIEVLSADARRFGRHGAYVETDRRLLAAFGTVQHLTQEHLAKTEDSAQSDAAREAVFAAAEQQLANTAATTIEGVIAKLRSAFPYQVGLAWADHAIVDPAHPDFVEGLKFGSMFDQLAWSAIEDLARIAGIDLGEKTTYPAASQHTAWLNERNDLLAAANRSEADVSDDEALSRINHLDARITDTPAASAEDVIAKLLMAVEVQAEGAEISTEQAVALVREAKAHLGIGYVYSAEVAA